MADEKPKETPIHRTQDPMDVLVGGDVPAAPGSRQFQCANCANKVYVAPSGQQRLKLNPHAKIICLECLLKMGGDPVLKRPTAAEILSDMSGTN